MSKPRQILAGQFYLITRRCTQRQFLLRPDAETNNAFIYCLAVAAQRCEVDVLFTLAESNHHHTVIFDRHGHCPRFVEHFHKLVARSQNVLRGRWENFWAAQEPCITRLLDRDAVIDKLVYAASNPVKDRLVQRVHQWPGPNAYVNLINGRRLHATRPRHFFRSTGPMPKAVSLQLTIPPELGPAESVIVEMRDGVTAIERLVSEECARTGVRVLGRRRVLEQSWTESPTSIEPRRRLRPRFAGNVAARIPALLGYRLFLSSYREARRRWLVGAPALFPVGTYWLARFAAMPIASAV
jgi:REP-associated tyrosine transposase